ncbi:MAG TPA: hypothetical protein VG142_03225 [Trebonia sp.]|nr:hypothetical protein [Trebonia sp.]
MARTTEITIKPNRREKGMRMIRLGSLAGYPFDGPRLLAGWPPPKSAAVYAITYKPDPAKDQHAVIYVAHSDDLSVERLPFKHPMASSWVKRAGSRWKLYICTYEIPGDTPLHREQITRELISIYHPGCNIQQYDPTWKPEWIAGSDSV